MLDIEKRSEGTALSVILSGRLDTTTSPQLEAELNSSLENVTSLVIDMADLDYISSAGLRVLLSAQKIMGRQGEMKVMHVSGPVMDIFEVTGFSEILTIE